MDTAQIKEGYIIKNLYREAKIMSRLRHPCIVNLFQTMQSGSAYCIVTEFIGGGDLCMYVKAQKYGRLDERKTKLFARQLISAISHMHHLGIVHRDLKMENIMLNSVKTQIKIVDFGLSNIYNPNCPLRTHCGSPEYAAPELFVPGRSYGPEVDLWSLGVILYGMLVGQLPFTTPQEENVSSQERRKQLLAQINRGFSFTQRKALTFASMEFRNIVARMLITDPAQRIVINEVTFHPWVTDKGIRTIRSNHLKEADKQWQMLILKQVSAIVHMELSEVQYSLSTQPLGDIAGIYQMLLYSQLSQNISCEGISKKVHDLPPYATARGPRSTRKNVIYLNAKGSSVDFNKTNVGEKKTEPHFEVTLNLKSVATSLALHSQKSTRPVTQGEVNQSKVIKNIKTCERSTCWKRVEKPVAKLRYVETEKNPKQYAENCIRRNCCGDHLVLTKVINKPSNGLLFNHPIRSKLCGNNNNPPVEQKLFQTKIKKSYVSSTYIKNTPENNKKSDHPVNPNKPPTLTATSKAKSTPKSVSTGSNSVKKSSRSEPATNIKKPERRTIGPSSLKRDRIMPVVEHQRPRGKKLNSKLSPSPPVRRTSPIVWQPLTARPYQETSPLAAGDTHRTHKCMTSRMPERTQTAANHPIAYSIAGYLINKISSQKKIPRRQAVP